MEAAKSICECSYSLYKVININYWLKNSVDVWKDFPGESGNRVCRVGKASDPPNHMYTPTHARTHICIHTHSLTTQPGEIVNVRSRGR